MKVGCIRVTHPCAGLKVLLLLPLDLHVLGLPLALILSQDQTLRCNLCFDLRSQFGKLTSVSYSLALFIINIFKELFFYIPNLLCLTSLTLLRSFRLSGCKSNALFCLSKCFRKFFEVFFASSAFRFPLGKGCKGNTLFRFSKYFVKFFFFLFA